MEENKAANRIKTPKKKSSAGVIALAIIDVVLLAVIIVSIVRKPEQGDSPSNVAASENTGDAEFHDFRYEDTLLLDDENENPLNDETEEDIDTDDVNADDVNADDVNADDVNADDVNADIVDEEIGKEDGGMTAADFSTTERPKLSDFMWYFDGAYYYGIPSDIEVITNPELLTGDWKGFIWYDPERVRNSYGLEFLNVNLDIDKSKVKIIFDLYQLSFEDTEIINEEDQDNLEFNGQWDNGRCDATGPGNVHIDTFYSKGDGKQYAVGTIDSPDGTPTYFAMIRP